jgi:lysine N6-hydroxylase
MNAQEIYDIIGIGIGPFNLGLAALSHPIKELNTLFFDKEKEFNWHPGMMIDNAKLQVPFYADLVTLADPCSRFSYLAFLKSKRRLFRFAIKEDNFIFRKEYNEYCRWVIGQLSNCIFGNSCESIHYDEKNNLYNVVIREVKNNTVTIYNTRKLVIGVGTVPNFPSHYDQRILSANYPNISHSSDYLHVKSFLHACKSVTIIGSGQSAAEIFLDLLRHSNTFSEGLSWFTSSNRFYPMEYTKLSLEMTSPEYIDHFYALPGDIKETVLNSQNALYKGINAQLINEIYDELYMQSLSHSTAHVKLHTNVKTTGILQMISGDKCEIQLTHLELKQNFTHVTNAVIFATGYRHAFPSFIDPVKELIQWSTDNKYAVNSNYSVDQNDSIFIQNAELHTHGFNAPDLGMGPYRNAIILNSILEREHFSIEKATSFQTFGLPQTI